MATLEKIRSKAGLLVSVVGLALFAFIIGDLLNSSSTIRNRNQNNVLVINGKAVDYQEYMSYENDMVERYKMQMGTSSVNETYMNQIRQVVYNDIVMEKVVDPRLEELGIAVTIQEMSDMVEGENISPMLIQNQMFTNPETGQFDRSALNMFLNQIKNIENFPPEYHAQLLQGKSMWMYLEKNIKRNRFYEKYATLLSKALVANSLEAKDAFDNSIISSDMVYAMESFASVSDSAVHISASELETLYNERKEMLRQQETCVIDYIAVDIAPSPEDFEQASKELDAIRAELETTDNVAALVNEKSEKKYSNAFFSVNGVHEDPDLIDFFKSASIGEIQGPVFKDNQYRILKLIDKTENADSVNVSILTPAARKTEPETRAYADSIINVIKAGTNFTEMVLKLSGDQYAKQDGVIGWVTEPVALQMINEEFRRTLFSLPVGQCAIVKSNYGIHIVKVTERTKIVPKYKVADIVYTVTPSSATRNQLYNALNQFIAQNNNIEKIEASAQESGYMLTPNVQVTSTDVIVGSVSGARQVVRWAFNHKKGQISDIIECENTFVVATHKGRLPEGYQSLATATPQLRSELIPKKKAEILAASLKAKGLSSIEDYAETMNVKPDTVKFITMATPRIANIGMEPKLNAFVTYAPLNELSEPVAGNNGVYVFQVFNRTNDQHLYVKENQISTLESNNAYRLGSFVFRFMQQNAQIIDNRVRFY